MDPITGLSNSKLELTTAITSDVLSGKTFYAGDKVLKTGTMINRGSWNGSVDPGRSITIPSGYHNGSGKITATGFSINNNFTYYSKTGQYQPCWKNYSINIGLGYGTNIFPAVVVKIGNSHAGLSSSGTLKISIGSTVLLNTGYYRPASNVNNGYGQWTYKFMDRLYSGGTMTVSVLNNTDDDELFVTVYGVGK